ncbi:MAG: AEC family transporter [Pseudomonadota bacterium]|nr:AEC family transporter [Pseudomonadota bacterium]
MVTVFSTIAPIFLIIVVGFSLRQFKVLGVGAWAPIERLTYYVFFPSLLFVSLATADVSNLPVGMMAAGVVGTPTVILLILLSCKTWLGIDGPAFTSVAQGATRFNTYIGIPLVVTFFGEKYITLCALFIGFMVPFINVVSVWLLTQYGKTGSTKGHPFGDIIKNPLIISCLAGIAVNLSGLGLTPPIETLFKLLGYAAPPVGLLCAGAGLDMVAVRAGRLWISISSGIKLIAMPGVALCLARILGLDEASSNVLILFHALPTAPSAYILARQLGGDARLMTGILTTQTAAAIVTLPLWLLLLGGANQ